MLICLIELHKSNKHELKFILHFYQCFTTLYNILRVHYDMHKSEYINNINSNVIEITRQHGSDVLILLSYDSTQQISAEK